MKRGEIVRIVASLTVACAIGAGMLGALYVATERYQRAAAADQERRAIAQLLDLDSASTVTEVRQLLSLERGEVIYRLGEASDAHELAFSLDGALARRGAVRDQEGLQSLGRLFIARRQGAPAGFVVEGVARGYKNRIRFLVGVTPDFEIAGVRVLEHEEDPGLGAEVATPQFQGQFIGRDVARLGALSRDPLPEDWRAALAELRRTSGPVWRARHAALVARERDRPIHAVTGATISSRALTDGVREALDHFRRRWALIGPHLEGLS